MNQDRAARPPTTEKPAHPKVAAALLMIGVVVFLVLVSALAVL